MDLVAATVSASGLVEHAIFGEDLIDCCPSTAGVVFTEDIFKIADEQGRYAAQWFSSHAQTRPTALRQTSVITRLSCRRRPRYPLWILQLLSGLVSLDQPRGNRIRAN